MNRPTCKCGRITPVNYKKNGKTYYRKKCSKCATADKIPKHLDWELAGYRKKDYCEKCNFKGKYKEQITVTKAIGVLSSYKSICLNCEVEINKKGGWKVGGLTPDF